MTCLLLQMKLTEDWFLKHKNWEGTFSLTIIPKQGGVFTVCKLMSSLPLCCGGQWEKDNKTTVGHLNIYPARRWEETLKTFKVVFLHTNILMWCQERSIPLKYSALQTIWNLSLKFNPTFDDNTKSIALGYSNILNMRVLKIM